MLLPVVMIAQTYPWEWVEFEDFYQHEKWDTLGQVRNKVLSIFDLSGKMILIERLENQNFVNIAQSIPTGLFAGLIFL